MLAAVILLLSVRGLLLARVILPSVKGISGMPSGHSAFVSLTYYGLRLPGEQFWGYHRWGRRIPAKGDPLAFNLPYRDGHALHRGAPISEGDLSAGVCRGLPDDTIWLDPVGKCYLAAPTANSRPLVIPGSRRPAKVTPDNAKLLAYIMQRYEDSHATIDGQGRLTLGGQSLNFVRLANDYYWIETRPGVFLLVPHCALLGKIVGGHRQ